MRGFAPTFRPVWGFFPVDEDKNQKIFEELLKIENEGIQNIPKSPIVFHTPSKISYR